MKKSEQAVAGFTLVEVVLALGISTLCFVSVLGLLGVGLTSSKSSSGQTVAANFLTAIAADLQSTPNPSPKGATGTNSVIYGITIPATGGSSTNATFYLGEDGQTSTNASTARYQVNTWSIPATAGRQETVVRILLTWPAQAAYTNAAGSVEGVVALNRTP